MGPVYISVKKKRRHMSTLYQGGKNNKKKKVQMKLANIRIKNKHHSDLHVRNCIKQNEASGSITTYINRIKIICNIF